MFRFAQHDNSSIHAGGLVIQISVIGQESLLAQRTSTQPDRTDNWSRITDRWSLLKRGDLQDLYADGKALGWKLPTLLTFVSAKG